MNYKSTKIIELGSCAFRQWRADSHCKYIHGYRLIAKFWFECEQLDERNWVVDFGSLKELKKDLEHQFDHTLCIASDDPLLTSFRELHRVGAVDLRIMADGVGIERTAEWCFKTADRHVRELTNNRCWVTQVEVWEHDKNSAIVELIKPTASNCRSENEVKGKFIAQQYELKLDQPSAPYATTVGAPAPEVQQAVNTGITPAPVRNEVSTGLGNPFKGTSWGY